MDRDVRMREAGHAGIEVADRYTHVLDVAHRAAAEQVTALVTNAGTDHNHGRMFLESSPDRPGGLPVGGLERSGDRPRLTWVGDTGMNQ